MVLSGFICNDPSEFIKRRNSRSSNNTEEILHANIHEIGLEYGTPTPGNGNCFFEAVRDQLKRLELPLISAYQLRLNIIKFCRDNPILKVCIINCIGYTPF